jgi:hypothetical protein
MDAEKCVETDGDMYLGETSLVTALKSVNYSRPKNSQLQASCPIHNVTVAWKYIFAYGSRLTG